MLWPTFANLFAPRFDCIQVEVTTHCQAACSYCPHTLCRDRWTSNHLPLAMFRRLLPDLKRANLVHLQGWGEPFLHPDIFSLISLARDAGCQVGTTTNGMLLDKDMLARLVDLEVAVVAFSLAGVGENNDRVRRGARFATVLEKIKILHEIKARKGAVLPQVHVAYMLLRSGLADLACLPRALAGLGVSQVVVSTLDFVGEPALAQESLRLITPEEHREAAARLDSLVNRSRGLGLSVHGALPPPGQSPPACPENLHRALVVAADGEVTPCVFLNLPVNNATLVNAQGKHPWERLSFGNLAGKSLTAIWKSPAYRQFRRALSRGPVSPPCHHCLKLNAEDF